MTNTAKPTTAQHRVLTEAADRIAAGGNRLVSCRSDMYGRLVAAGWVAGSDITDAGLAVVGRNTDGTVTTTEQRVEAAGAARAEQILDALAATAAAPGCMVPATVDEHLAGLLADAGFTFRGRITNRGIERLTAARGEDAVRALVNEATANAAGDAALDRADQLAEQGEKLADSELVDGPVDGFAIGDVVQWAGAVTARQWKIARLYVPRNGDAPYAGLDLLDDQGPGKTSTAGRLSLLVKVDPGTLTLRPGHHGGRSDVLLDGRVIGNVAPTGRGWDGETEHGLHLTRTPDGRGYTSATLAAEAVRTAWLDAEQGPVDEQGAEPAQGPVDGDAEARCGAMLADPKTHAGKVEPYLFEQGAGGSPVVEPLCEVHGSATVARLATRAEVERYARGALTGEVVDPRPPVAEVLGDRNGYAVVLHPAGTTGHIARDSEALLSMITGPQIDEQVARLATGGHLPRLDAGSRAAAEAPQLAVGDDVLDPDGRRAQVAQLTTIKIRGTEHPLAMIDYFDAPADTSGPDDSTPILVAELRIADPLPRVDGDPVIVEAHVEDMSSSSNRYEIDRASWESWPPARRAREVDTIGAEEVSAAGGYGASVVDE